MKKLLAVVLLILSLNLLAQNVELPKVEVLKSELIFNQPPFAQCHASTIVELDHGRMGVACFGGQYERHPEVAIWFAVSDGQQWSEPKKIADGVINDTLRFPSWNPVLFRDNKDKLTVFFKVGPSPQEWWGMSISSDNFGKSWQNPEQLPDGFLGPIKNKAVVLSNGDILCPSSVEDDRGWRVHLERISGNGKKWSKIEIDPKSRFNVIQPSILFYPGNRLQLLCRSQENCIVESWSDDNGISWGPLTLTSVPNPNSGSDAVTLNDGRQLLVYNPLLKGADWFNGRNKLHVAISNDGKKWDDVAVLENQAEGEYSYPAVIQATDGLVHITYTYQRINIKHIVLKVE